MRYVRCKDLKPGMILATTIYDDNENMLLRSNTELKNTYISRIISLEYDGVYVYEDNHIVEKMNIISEKTRIAAFKNLKKLNLDECLFLANSIVEEIRDSDSICVEMLNLSSYDNYTYIHSVNVDVLSVIIGIGMGLEYEELKNLSEAALLHDIGKSCIDESILNKPSKLDEEEYEEIKKHPLYGYHMVKENPLISSTVKNAIYSHHENEDGSGYPRGLQGKNIHKFAKIIHVADVYDALTAKRVYKEAINPADAIEFLMANIEKMFDREVVHVFLKYVAPYPIGTMVELSNGETAYIYKNHPELLLRPFVRLENGEILDLSVHYNITIVNVSQ